MKKLKLHELEKLSLTKNEMGKAGGGAVPPIKDECFTSNTKSIVTYYAGMPPLINKCLAYDGQLDATV